MKGFLVSVCFLAPASSLRVVRDQEGQPRGEFASQGLDIQQSNDKLGKLLFVVPVGGTDFSIQQTKLNVDHLRKTFPGPVDVHLFHYDNRQHVWMKDSPDWYQRNVQRSLQQKGRKFGLLTKSYSDYTMIGQYDWVWAMDEDFDITTVDMPLMMRTSEESGSKIVMPAVGFRKTYNKSFDKVMCYEGEQMCNHQSSHSGCKYRYTNFVELMLPMFRPAALWKVMTECDHCIHTGSEWGLDEIWCNLVADKFQMKNMTSCAILDKVQATKLNWHTLHKETKTNHRAVEDARTHNAQSYATQIRSHCVPTEA